MEHIEKQEYFIGRSRASAMRHNIKGYGCLLMGLILPWDSLFSKVIIFEVECRKKYNLYAHLSLYKNKKGIKSNREICIIYELIYSGTSFHPSANCLIYYRAGEVSDGASVPQRASKCTLVTALKIVWYIANCMSLVN